MINSSQQTLLITGDKSINKLTDNKIMINTKNKKSNQIIKLIKQFFCNHNFVKHFDESDEKCYKCSKCDHIKY